MARMIPAQIYTGTPSLGEREIYQRLANDPNTQDWIVLHSLDIAEHTKRISGEADFVIIVPQKGILCLEVKATTSIRREDGVWYYGNNPNPDVRGPFKQSSEAMHSIRQRLVEKHNNLANIPFWSAVIFPYLQFNIHSGEWHHWQVIDSNGFQRKSISSLIIRILNEARTYLKINKAKWFDEKGLEPTKQQCELIAGSLRPSFEVYESPRSRVERLEQEVKRYTEEQFIALDAMVANPRVIYSGPAGTGKTILAIEAARRSQAGGNRVLLLCYNSLLGDYLKAETSTIQARVTAITLHKHLLAVAGVKLQGERPPNAFWVDDLPKMAIDKLLEDTTATYQYDEIIVDEAQDLLRNSYLDFLDLSLTGGLLAGNWKFFGDFERQAIYGSQSDTTLYEAIHSRLGNAPQFVLRTNCRNTPRIAALVHLLGSLEPEYTRILRPDDGAEPQILYYVDDEDQRQCLFKAVQKLKQEGFANADIMVLSTKSSERSIASSHDTMKFVSLETAYTKHIRCGSIHAFKGMESSAIIVTDVDTIRGDQAAALFYVAMTRALHRLYILAKNEIRNDVLKIILQR
ncbi:MAG: NERD domain-containing protein [Anaerolineae bacterium]|nr:NERD domain-containing protein [Anaerolineae bacterium]